LSDGILDNSSLENEIRRMCGDVKPLRRFGIVMTHTRTCTPTLVEWPEAGWTHLAASCAVPLFLRNYQFGGEWYSDGGLVDPLPTEAAIKMGARSIVAVNLLKHRPWAVRLGVEVLRRWSGYAPPRAGDIKLIEVCADSPLGAVRDSMYWSRESAARLIERGRQDARKAKPAIVQWSEREIPELGNLPYSSSARSCADALQMGASHSGTHQHQTERL
jgi:predicted acylesterase/phospholipase RssA